MLLREKSAQQIDLTCSLAQVKKLYLALFRQLHAGGAGAMAAFDDDDDMLLTLQTYLQRRAKQQDVDCTDHAQWDAFLGVDDAPPCEVRFANRARPSADG